MVDEGKEILCEKCETKMVKDQCFPPRSLDMYSDSTNITHTSVGTSVTTRPLMGTSTTSGTGQPYSGDSRVRLPIRIVNYTCPSCGWKTQIRE